MHAECLAKYKQNKKAIQETIKQYSEKLNTFEKKESEKLQPPKPQAQAQPQVQVQAQPQVKQPQPQAPSAPNTEEQKSVNKPIF